LWEARRAFWTLVVTFNGWTFQEFEAEQGVTATLHSCQLSRLSKILLDSRLHVLGFGICDGFTPQRTCVRSVVTRLPAMKRRCLVSFSRDRYLSSRRFGASQYEFHNVYITYPRCRSLRKHPFTDPTIYSCSYCFL
jgi:hypothetical protein